MRLDASTLEELAAFFNRRLPDGAGSVADACGLARPEGHGLAAWHGLVLRAEAAGRLPALAAAVSRALPGDENAERAAKDLAPSRSWGVVGAVAALALVVVGVGVALSAGTAQAEIRPEPVAVAAPESAPAAVTAVAPESAPAPAAAAPPKTSVGALGTPSPNSSVGSFGRSGGSTLPPSSKVPRSGCRSVNGGTVGWWYAGQAAPGLAGETITLSRGANVRADVPTAAGHWRLAEPVGCGLEAGDRVTLGEVRAIPGGVWVEFKG